MAFNAVDGNIFANNLGIENDFAFRSLPPFHGGGIWGLMLSAFLRRASEWADWLYWSVWPVAFVWLLILCARCIGGKTTSILMPPPPLRPQTQNVQRGFADVVVRNPAADFRGEIEIAWDVESGNVQHVWINDELLAKTRIIKVNRKSATMALF